MKLKLERLLADQAFECGDPRLVLLDQVGRVGIVVEGPRFVLLDPDTDQLAGNVMRFESP